MNLFTWKAIYGLPQAGILANKLLRSRLAPDGYYKVAHTPGLLKHVTRPLQLTLCQHHQQTLHLLRRLDRHSLLWYHIGLELIRSISRWDFHFHSYVLTIYVRLY